MSDPEDTAHLLNPWRPGDGRRVRSRSTTVRRKRGASRRRDLQWGEGRVIRCSPEQLRHATSEERAVAEFDEAELLGIRTMLERGQLPKGQFVDAVAEGTPSPGRRQCAPSASRCASSLGGGGSGRAASSRSLGRDHFGNRAPAFSTCRRGRTPCGSNPN